MKTSFVIGSFAIFAFAVLLANANIVRKPGEINLTAKIQKTLNQITSQISEPIVLSEKNINPYEELNLTVSGTISGLTSLAVNDFKVYIIGGISISNYEFVLPKLSVDITSYDFDGKLGLTHIYGKGQLILNLEDVVLKGNAKLAISSIDGIQYVQISTLTADLSLAKDKFYFKITGWLNNEDQSYFISNLINNLVHNMTPEGKTIVDKQLSDILTTQLADFKIPMNDLLRP